MARKRQAAQVLDYAVIYSCLGRLFSVGVLNLVVPQLAKVALTFSQPEYFALAVTALPLIASFGSRGMQKAAISGAFGLLAATIGIDPMTSEETG